MKDYNLERNSIHHFYIIEADSNGARKYVSRAFPRTFQYTIKISKAQPFQTEDLAWRFINSFNEYGKYPIVKPIIKKVCREFIIEEV